MPALTGIVATALSAPPIVRLSSRRFVLLIAVVVAVVRTSRVSGPLFSDEAGYLLVARGLRAGGPNLYGHYFVDRPPLLIALYRVAALTGWPQSIRVLALASAVGLVLAAGWAAHQVAGDRGARWAALAAGALVTTPLLLAREADGEIFAAPLVMLAIALALLAVRRAGRGPFLPAVGAGVSAGLAVMVKQNFVDGAVFATVLLAAAVLQHRLTRRQALGVAGGGLVGGGLVLAGTAAFVVWSRVGISVAWTAVFGSRSAALDVIEDHSLHAPLLRAVELVGLAVVTGLLPLLAVLLLHVVRFRRRGAPVAWAVGVTVLVELSSIAMGGSYWAHYLLQLVPTLALAAGLWAPGSVPVRQAVAFVVASSVAASTVLLVSGATPGQRAQDVGAWLRRSGRPGDTATVLFGNADAQLTSGMASPYDELWTLPMRTFDPHLARLRAVLRGNHPPTWVVATGGLDPWHIDARDRLRHELESRYRLVAHACGARVYLRDGVHRPPAPAGCPRQ